MKGHADLLRRRKVARSVRADDVRTPRAIWCDAREECIVERLFDAIEVLRLTCQLPELTVEANPVRDVA